MFREIPDTDLAENTQNETIRKLREPISDESVRRNEKSPSEQRM